MPNDNTHTPKPFYATILVKYPSEADCPRVGANEPVLGGELVGISFTDMFAEMEELQLDTRTPAEPKAGDWDAALLDTLLYSQGHGIKTPPHEDPSDILDEYEKSIPDGAYRESIRSIRRALSSAAPRITEEMVERITVDQWGDLLCDHARSWRNEDGDCGKYIDEDDLPNFLSDVLALLRQQGPPPFTSTQTEE